MLPSLRVQSWCRYLFLTLMKCLNLLFSAAMKVLLKDEPEIVAISLGAINPMYVIQEWLCLLAQSC